jgi:hypothetical protein
MLNSGQPCWKSVTSGLELPLADAASVPSVKQIVSPK